MMWLRRNWKTSIFDDQLVELAPWNASVFAVLNRLASGVADNICVSINQIEENGFRAVNIDKHGFW